MTTEPTNAELADDLESLSPFIPEGGMLDASVLYRAASRLRSDPPVDEQGVGGESLQAAINLAYGLLWHMQIDTRDPNLELASNARKALLAVMTKDDQCDGITRAKMTDARFTGAA